jgi:hypothetical protein
MNMPWTNLFQRIAHSPALSAHARRYVLASPLGISSSSMQHGIESKHTPSSLTTFVWLNCTIWQASVCIMAMSLSAAVPVDVLNLAATLIGRLDEPTHITSEVKHTAWQRHQKVMEIDQREQLWEAFLRTTILGVIA